MNSKENLKDYLLEEFEKNKEFLKNISLPEIFELRIKSINYLSENGFPTRKNEEWRFTNINPIIKNSYLLGGGISSSDKNTRTLSQKEINKYLIKNLDVNLLVLIDGVYSGKHSLLTEKTDSAYIGSLLEIQKSNPDLAIQYFGKSLNTINDTFTAVNTAFSTDGVFIYIPKNVSTQKPFHILNLITEKNLLSNNRNIIIADVGSDLTIIESYHLISDDNSIDSNLFNSVTEIFLNQNSRVHYYKIQKDEKLINNIGTTQVIQKRDSHFNSFTMTLSGNIVRNNLNSALQGENCECIFKGVYVGDNSSLIDNHTLVDHAVPNCYSNEYYKGIIGDESHGVFNGKIIVRKDAQKTNAYQSNKNILISDKATINAKPQLEIFADDVKCSHGATSGRLNADELFYLRARGIPEKVAQRLLLFAFLTDVVEVESNYSESKSYRKTIDKCIVKAISEKINSINL